MEDFKLLTVRDLAIRWQCNEVTIRGYVSDGIIKPCKGVPGVKFHPEHIRKLEGVELEKFSPLEKQKLEREIEELKNTIKLQNETLRKIAALGTESMIVLQRAI